jgi:two-component sensor histidine kinase
MNDTLMYVKSSCQLAGFYSNKSQFQKAEKTLLLLLPLVNGSRKKLLKGLVYNYFGNIYKLSLNLAPALQSYLKAETIFEKEKSNPDLIRLFVDMAEYYRSIGQYADAKRYANKALNIYETSKSNDISKLIRIYNRMAAIYNESSNSDSCQQFSLKALTLSKQIGDFNSEAISLNEIGFSMKNLRKVDSSSKCYKRAIYLWTKIGDDLNAVHAKYNLAMLYSHNYFPKDTIIPLYKDIIKLVKEKHIDYPLDQVYFGLSDCYFFNGDSLDCYRIRRKAYEALIDKNRKMYDVEVNNIKEKYENKKYQQQISKVSDELETSEKNLIQKERENRIIYLSLAVLTLLIVVIGFLTRRIYLTNQTLNSKNKEKDTLIQEIHHRVKNNLQFVSSLINMQINSSKTGPEVESLNDTSRRIRSMALVHEMLYNQNNMDGIEIKKYLEELVSSINDIVNSQKIPIRFVIDCDEFIFETPNAIALGMITSELVSNSIKYAFMEIKNPTITIELKKMSDDDRIRFILKDNGKGLSETVKDMHGKLGMRLINIFSRQIKGEYSFKNDSGLMYTLVFQNKFRK